MSIIQGSSSKNILVHCVIFGGIVVLILAAELVLARFPDINRVEKKVWIVNPLITGNCYTANCSSRLPIDLRGSVPDELSLRISPASLFKLKSETPHCIFYNLLRRRQGPFPERSIQATIIGGSVAFGEGIGEEETLAYQLAKRFPNANFRNFAVPDTDIRGILTSLTIALNAEPRPQHVIYIYNLNDLAHPPEWEREPGTEFDLQDIRWDILTSINPVLPEFIRNSALIRLIAKTAALRKAKAEAIFHMFTIYSDTAGQERFAQTMGMIKIMNQICLERGVTFNVVLYPLMVKDPMGRYPFVPIHTAISNNCLENSISCIDVAGAFDSLYSMDNLILQAIDWRPNGKAHHLVVEYLAKQKKLKFPGVSAPVNTADKKH